MSIIPQKQCRKCSIDKPLADFYTRSDSPDGYYNACKKCHQAPRTVFIAKTEKICRRCNLLLPISAYNKDMRQIDGTHSYCRECRKEYDKQWRIEHRNICPEYAVRWRAKPGVKQKLSVKMREIGLRWRLRNPERVKALHHARRARVRAGGTYRPEHWVAMCAFFGHICLACKQSKPLTIDHVIPTIHGGKNSIENLQPLCLSCNSSKQDKHIDYRNPAQLSIFLNKLLQQSLLF